MSKGMGYGDFINILEHSNHIRTRMDAVSYVVGYFGCLSKEHWEFIVKAYADGFLDG